MELSRESWMMFFSILAVVIFFGWVIFLLELILLRIAKRLGEGTWGVKRWFWDSVWKSLLAMIILIALGFFLADKPDAADLAQEENPERAYYIDWLAGITVFWILVVGLATLSVVCSYLELIIKFIFKQLPVQKEKSLSSKSGKSLSSKSGKSLPQEPETPISPRSGLAQAVAESQDLEQIPRIPYDHDAPRKGEPEPSSLLLGMKKETFTYDKKNYEQLLTAVIIFCLIPVFGIAYCIYHIIVMDVSQSMLLILLVFSTGFMPPIMKYFASRPRLLSIEIFEKGIRGNERGGSNDFPWDKIRFVKKSEFEHNEKTYQCVVLRRDDNLELTAESRMMADVDKLWDYLHEIAEERGIDILGPDEPTPVTAPEGHHKTV